MKNLKVYFLILGSVFFLSCSQQKNKIEPKRTVIAGVVNNFSDNANVLVVNYCDPLSEDHQFAQNLVESNGHFQTDHHYMFAQNLTIRITNRFINLFVYPGDSLFISIDANELKNNFDNAVKFSSSNSELNKELFIWTNNAYQTYNPQFDDSASPEDFLESVRKDFEIAQDSINSYYQRTKISGFLQKWAFIDHKFITANILMDYHNKEANKWDIFTNPIFDVFNEDNFQTMYFHYHLDVCMSTLVQSEVEISNLFKEKEYVPAIQLTVEKLFEKAPRGLVRDVMLFRFLKNTLKEMPELYDSIPEIKTAFSHDYFNKELERLVENNKTEQTQSLLEKESQLGGVLFMKDGKIEALPNVKLLHYLLGKYEGKVLYLDIWATWCGPCVKEFEFTPNLHKYFKDKDVVFVNLCLDSKTENWEQAIKKNNIGGENYFLADDISKLFMAENKLSGFPSYLVIDKNGEIHYPAPRPSDLESAIKKIESCLK